MPGASILITSAPKSDITVAAAGPAMKLAQSITFSPSKTRSPIADLSSNHESERVAVALDPAGGAPGEVRADDQGRAVGEAGQHPLAGLPRQGRIGIGGRGPLRTSDLAGVVHEVAGDQRLFAARGDAHTDMTGGMARGRDEADFVADPVIGLDEIDKAGIPDRGHRISEDRSHVLTLVLLGPMRIFYSADQVARVRKGRDPPAVDQHRVPADVIDVEMRADHRVDRLARIAGGGEIREEARLELVPGRYPPVLLVVAETGID